MANFVGLSWQLLHISAKPQADALPLRSTPPGPGQRDPLQRSPGHPRSGGALWSPQ
jgi:hypothetical protein